MMQAVHASVDRNSGVLVRSACRALGLARSGYYRWRKRGKERGRGKRDASLRRAVIRVAGKKTRYGARRVCAHLRREGMDVGKKRVGRLMREEGLGYEEIAEALGLSLASVGTTLSRARRRLMEAYESLQQERSAERA